MYGCKSWTIKKAEHWRIDAFELWCWRRLLKVPWTARRSNQSILKEISPGCSLEGLMLKLKLQYFGHLMRRADSFEKTLMLGRLRAEGEGEQQRMRWLDGITNSMDTGLGRLWELWWTGNLACCSPWGLKESDWNEWLSWTDPTKILDYICVALWESQILSLISKAFQTRCPFLHLHYSFSLMALTYESRLSEYSFY